jgi:hypothetical protein
MKVSQLKEQIRGIIRERSVKAIQKDYSNVVSDMEKHLELYKKSKGTPEEKKHIGHLKDLTAKKKKLQAELDLAVAGLYKNAELKVDEALTYPKRTNPSDLAKTALSFYDFYTDYIDDGGRRRSVMKRNDDVVEWFASHPKEIKEKAYKMMLSQHKGDSSKIERTFGKHLNESVIKENTRRVKLLGIDFKVSEMNGRIFFSFVDKKAATIQLRKVGTNKIVNHIQNRLDIAFGKGEFFFKSGDHAEFQNGYLFQRNPSNINLNKIKFESVNESKEYKKGDKLKIKLPNGKKFDVVFVDYSNTNGIAYGKFKVDGEVATKPFSVSSIVESVIREDIKKDIDKFIDKLNKQFPDQEYTISSGGGKYARINHKNRKFGGESAWGFISLVDNPTKGFKKGDLLKAAGYNTPAKHARGNILNGDAKYDKYSPTYLKEEVNESTEPQVISQLRDIVKKKQYQDVKDPSSGKKMKVDMQTANIVLKIYDGLSNVNKQTMVKMGLPKMIDVSNKIASKYR